MNNNIKKYYLQTSCFTDLGMYKEFVQHLPNNVNDLCLLQRRQIIHPFSFFNKKIYIKDNCYWGNMKEVPIYKLKYEDDIFPTAQSILAELLRRDSNYGFNRKDADKVHVTCRGQAILLTAILKAKGIPARCRSGFTFYVTDIKSAGDHWITEYYDFNQKRWVLIDADMHDSDRNLGFDVNDIPKNEFIFGAEAYLGLRNGKYKENEIYYASDPKTYGLNASIRALFYDFHCLMNDEIIFLHVPKYIQDKKFKLSKKEYQELDELAMLMLNPDENFDKLVNIWNNDIKYRIMSGALNQ